jgi:hypothetical protein
MRPWYDRPKPLVAWTIVVTSLIFLVSSGCFYGGLGDVDRTLQGLASSMLAETYVIISFTWFTMLMIAKTLEPNVGRWNVARIVVISIGTVGITGGFILTLTSTLTNPNNPAASPLYTVGSVLFAVGIVLPTLIMFAANIYVLVSFLPSLMVTSRTRRLFTVTRIVLGLNILVVLIYILQAILGRTMPPALFDVITLRRFIGTLTQVVSVVLFLAFLIFSESRDKRGTLKGSSDSDAKTPDTGATPPGVTGSTNNSNSTPSTARSTMPAEMGDAAEGALSQEGHT